MTNLDVAMQVAFSFLGIPYIWGGDDPMRGFDCSGYVIEILKSVGILPQRGDWRAKDLYSKFVDNSVDCPSPGALVFWGESAGTIRHVEFCVSERLSIGASGGGSKNQTREDSVKYNSYVKVRPIRGRGQVFAFVQLF